MTLLLLPSLLLLHAVTADFAAVIALVAACCCCLDVAELELYTLESGNTEVTGVAVNGSSITLPSAELLEAAGESSGEHMIATRINLGLFGCVFF